MAEIENKMVVDEYWVDIEKKREQPDGYFDQWGSFVYRENLLEVALEDVQKDSISRERFLEKVLDYIESDKEATEKFLKWYYPDYGKEK